MWDDGPPWLIDVYLMLLQVPAIVYLSMLAWMTLGRPMLPRAGPPTADLGPQPPGVVALMLNRWRVDAAAAAATLLDLAARRYIDLTDLGTDPAATGVTVRRRADAGLREYERELLDHVTDRGPVGYTVPLAAVASRPAGERRAFRRRFSRALHESAREQGVATRTPGETWEGFFFMGSLGSAANATILLTFWLRDWTWWLVGPISFFALYCGLLVLSQLPLANNWSTPAGRQAARRWRGVRTFLDTTGAFGDLPPTAVAVWDRYLAYAAALGSARSAVDSLSAVWAGPAAAPDGPVAKPAMRTVRAAPRRSPRDPAAPDPARVRTDLRALPGVWIGDIVVDDGWVRTPVGGMPLSRVGWEVEEKRRWLHRFDPLAVALALGTICLFPLNLLFLALSADERKGDGGVFVVTVSADGVSYTTRVPFTDGDEHAAIYQHLIAVGARTGPGPYVPRRRRVQNTDTARGAGRP